jgi:UDP-glucose 4-epimerase
MTRAVILGGSGFIGQNLVRSLRGIADTLVYDLKEPPVERPGAYVRGDMDEIEKIRGILEPGDHVFHLVHSSIPSESDQAPLEDLSTNLFRFIKLMEVLADRKVCRIIYSSSGGTVYGEPEEVPISESAGLRPVSSYGIVKVLMERYLGIFRHQRELDYIILRISNPYGPWQEMSNRHGAVPSIMRALIRSEPFTIYGDGDTVRDYIYIQDVCAALAGILQSDLKNMVFNIGTGEGNSLNQLISIIEGISGLKLKVLRKPIRSSDLRTNILDASSIKQALAWKPEIDLVDGLRKTWEYWCGLENP